MHVAPIGERLDEGEIRDGPPNGSDGCVDRPRAPRQSDMRPIGPLLAAKAALGERVPQVGFELPERVGSFPTGIGLFGQHDMAGNAWEWVLDAPAGQDHYPEQPSNPVNLCGYKGLPPDPDSERQVTQRVIRGGSYQFGPDRARTSARFMVADTYRFRDIGVRCARPAAN